MNIVHIAPNSPYNDGWGYQENLLPKYQHKLGHKVTLIVSDKMFYEGKIVTSDEVSYISKNGYKVIRGHYHKYINKKITKLISKINVYDMTISSYLDCHVHNRISAWTGLQGLC